MNLRTIKRPEERFDVSYLSTYGIKAYGIDNLAPQNWALAIANSPTGSVCLNRYARFIEGGGFRDVAFSEMLVNRQGDTVDDLFKLCAEDLALYNGVALHVNYDVNGAICEVQHVPFEQCRLKEDDDSGYISHIAVHPDWSGRKTRNGRRMRVSEDSITYYDVFNTLPPVLAAQIAAAGGIESYRGQVLWVSAAGRHLYPRPKYDAVVTELSTDEGLSNVKCRNVRNNFFGAGILYTYNASAEDPDIDTGDGYSDLLAHLQGDTDAFKLMEIRLRANEQKPELVAFPSTSFDKEFSVTEESVTDRIYSAFEQEAFLAVRNGKIGFGGTVIEDAYRYYAALVSKEQRLLSRAFARIFDHWYAPVSGNYDIEPLTFSNSTTNE